VDRLIITIFLCFLTGWVLLCQYCLGTKERLWPSLFSRLLGPDQPTHDFLRRRSPSHMLLRIFRE
ncbi:unnamed protein product, partial [Amoebophrya sp. A25]